MPRRLIAGSGIALVAALAWILVTYTGGGAGDPPPPAEAGPSPEGAALASAPRPGPGGPAGVAAAAPEPGPTGAPPGAPATGGGAGASSPEETYRVHCSPCHGPEGLGDGPLASALPVRPANIQAHMDHHTIPDLTRLILDGIPPAMPPAPIGPEEAERLVRYLLAVP